MVINIMNKNKFFEVYDELIEEIPSSIKVKNYNIGKRWSYIETKDNLGMGLTVDVDSIDYSYSGSLIGKSLKDVANLVKSWNLRESSLGLAAINSYYNTADNIQNLGAAIKDEDAFDVYRNIIQGKKVSVIGHFPFLERQLKDICELYILEKKPSKGDYPDSACEFLLPQSDYVFVTSSTFANKTFPRLLELSKNGKLIMVGPSTPLTPKLFKYGIEDLSGFIVNDRKKIKEALNDDIPNDFFQFGKMISLKNK